jgi:hypothetical protein
MGYPAREPRGPQEPSGLVRPIGLNGFVTKATGSGVAY